MTTAPNPGGSAPAGNPPADGTGSTPPPPEKATAVVETGTDWLRGLTPENREIAVKKGWDKSNSPDVVLTSYSELESRLGKSIVLPSAEAPKEDWDKLYGSLGKPEKPDGYKFKLPDGVPADFPYDDAFATEYRVWAHEAGLNPQQAQSLHDKFVLRSATELSGAAQAQQARVTAAHSEIVNKWGDEASDNYKRNLALASRALTKLGLVESYKAAGLVTADGKITDAKVAFALATTGAGLYAEDKRHGEPNFHVDKNPWKDGQENLTEQGRIQRENPELAKTLISAAGKDPTKEIFVRK